MPTTLTHAEVSLPRDRPDTAQAGSHEPAPVELPPLDCYWSPGPETSRERLKLKMLHSVAEFGGVLRRIFGRLATSTVGILTYHRIAPHYPDAPFPTINVTPAAFRSQLAGLQKLGFRFASLDTVLAACAGDTPFQIPERTVVVTFDDIYDNVFQNAWPVLRELKIPATAFVSTAFIDVDEPFLFDPWARKHRSHVPFSAWLPIRGAHLREMQDTGQLQLGAHTHTHQDFRHRPDAFAADVAAGIRILRERFGVDRPPFAFPYGSPRNGFCNERLMKTVRRLNLQCGLTTASHTNGLETAPFGWGRFHVFQHDTPASLAGKLDGWYEWLPRLKTTLLRRTT